MHRVLIPAVLLTALAAPAHAETRNLSGFNSVSVSAGIEAEIVVGPHFSVDVQARHPDRIVTRVHGDALVIERRRQAGFSWNNDREATVRITMPAVEGLSASSGASIDANGVQGGAVALDSSSGANIDVAGACTSVAASVSSGAKIDARELRCASGNVDASSGGEVAVFVDGPLNVDASSGGDVLAMGGAEIGNVSLSSGGSLRRR